LFVVCCLSFVVCSPWQLPITHYPLPITYYLLPTTNNQQPTTNNKILSRSACGALKQPLTQGGYGNAIQDLCYKRIN
ncbi:MAG TPA: hypothetical protein DDZ80_29120, partial [Cyanobacteria bacterium UBA8803]|nr:hypothetical protein [Cyanobacteria bacterium UBA8803]